MPEVEYQILLEKELNDKARTTIENIYRKTLTPISENINLGNQASEINNCYSLNLDVDEDDTWDLAIGISQLKGVRDVEPNFFIPGIREDMPKITACFPPPDHFLGWHKIKTKFKEAEEFANSRGRTVGGKGIRIAQLDTGYTDHPELYDILKHEGYDVYKGDLDPRDDLEEGLLLQPSHGTSTASVITASEKKLNDGQTLGLAPHVTFIPFRISPSVIHIARQTIEKGVIKAIEASCKVITLSMGGAPPRKFWEIATTEAYERGVIWVCAAGNVVEWVVWPARYPQNICVAATGFTDFPWEDSCKGKSVDLSAPGHNVYVATTRKEGKFCYKNGSGTSYATPHVAAAAAVWLAYHGNDLNQYPLPWQKVEAFRYCLKKSAYTPSWWDKEYKKLYGAGILDAERLLKIELPDKENLRKRIFPIRYNQPGSISVNMVHKEIMYLTLSAEQKKKLNLEYIYSKASKNAKARLDKKLTSSEIKTKSEKKKLEMLKNAFLIAY